MRSYWGGMAPLVMILILSTVRELIKSLIYIKTESLKRKMSRRKLINLKKKSFFLLAEAEVEKHLPYKN